ncbi:MAG: CopG family transcriptional regulator [Anaerolineae bacterium]|nr:CopG family transcriptional regulator [Anaerolineae bacterium]
MVRTQIQLTEEQSLILKAIAREKEVSVAEIIRQSIDSYIRSVNQVTLAERRERALAAVGKFISDETDLSNNHDLYLSEAYEDFGE